jgi:hemerythrin-like domain-containing protein
VVSPFREESELADPISMWHAEHAYFNRLLNLLREQVEVFHSGQRPNYELMIDIISYLRDFTDRVHHPREDVAFARLAKHLPDMDLTLARLVQEHRIIAHAGDNLHRLLTDILGGAVIRRAETEVAAATYLVYYGNHIAREEEVVLDRAAEMLTAEDWEAVKNAVPAMRDPLAGDGLLTHYQELRRHLAREARERP